MLSAKKSRALYVLYYELRLPKSLGRLCGECERFNGESTQQKGQRALLICVLPLPPSDWESFSSEHTRGITELLDGSCMLMAEIEFPQHQSQAQSKCQQPFLHQITRPLLLASVKKNKWDSVFSQLYDLWLPWSASQTNDSKCIRGERQVLCLFFSIALCKINQLH